MNFWYAIVYWEMNFQIETDEIWDKAARLNNIKIPDSWYVAPKLNKQLNSGIELEEVIRY